MMGSLVVLMYLYNDQQQSLESSNGYSKEKITVRNTDKGYEETSVTTEVVKVEKPSKKDIALNAVTKLTQATKRTPTTLESKMSANRTGADSKMIQDANTVINNQQIQETDGLIIKHIINNDLVLDEEKSIEIVTRVEQEVVQINTIESRASIGRFDEVSSLVPLDFSKLDFKREPLNLDHETYTKVDLVSERSEKIDKWSIFMNTGVSYINRQLSTDNTEFEDRSNRRGQIEKVLGGWDVSAGLTYRFGQAFSVASGLSIGQIHEQARYTTSYLIESQTDQVTVIIHEQDGDIKSLTENVTSYTNRETNEIRYNTLKYYSIPLILNYRVIENEKYRLRVNANIAYSISQHYSGATSYNENEEAYSLGLDSRNDFNRLGAISYGLGLDASRKLSKNWDFNLGLSARRLEGISSSTNPIKQEYNLFTLNFGVSKRI